MRNHAWRVLVLTSLALAGCEQPAGVQLIDRDKLRQSLRAADVAIDRYFNYGQDAQGQAIFLFGDNRLQLLLRADDPRSRRISTPSFADGVFRTLWLDPQGRYWSLPPFAFPEHEPGVYTTLDGQSGFFLQSRQGNDAVYVGQVQHGTSWLFTLHVTDRFKPMQVCARGDVVYLLDHRDRVDPAFMHKQINCWALAPNPDNAGEYIKIDEFSVPGMVKLVDPFSPRFLCDGYGYMPFPGRPFLYDIRTHSVIQTYSSDAMVVFLKDHWLSERLGRR